MAFHFGATPQLQPIFLNYNEQEATLWHLSGAPSMRGVWKKRTPGLPMLINGSGLYHYGALHFSYGVETYTVHYGALHFSYILGGIVEASISSTVAATGACSALAVFESLVMSSAAAATTSMSTGKTVDGTIDASVSVAAPMVANATLYALISSAVDATFFVRFDGQTFPAWAVNLASFAPSRYTNYDFNSFARIGGVDLAANSSGLYQLGGDDDDGTEIDASIMLGRDPRGSSRAKRSNRVYLHGTSDSKLEVRVVDAEGNVHTYQSEVTLSDVVSVQRVKLGKGLIAHYWQLEVRNVAGGDFALEQIEIVSLHTDRRVKRK